MADPYPKSEQVARGPKRPARIKASREEWQRIVEAKRGPCRVCGTTYPPVEYHHLISRAQGGGDVLWNIVPLCPDHHRDITERRQPWLKLLAASLTDDEYAWLIDKLGEGALERLFGVLDSGVRS